MYGKGRSSQKLPNHSLHMYKVVTHVVRGKEDKPRQMLDALLFAFWEHMIPSHEQTV